MGILMDTFNKNFEKATGMTVDEAQRAIKNQKEITARTGNNVSFDSSYNNDWNRYTAINGLSDNFANALKDALGYYKKEFKINPRANIYSDWENMYDGVEGMAYELPNKKGNYDVNLRHVREHNERDASQTAAKAEQEGWWAKGYGGNLNGVPTHELGHVLTFQLFPDYDKVKNLYTDAMKDVGVEYDPKSQKSVLQAAKKAKEISGYAAASNALPPYAPWNDEYETIAEALTDYYYNRDKAADLSKAIVKRMKSKGATYGLEQAGGVAGPNETFMQNLRRYSAIQ